MNIMDYIDWRGDLSFAQSPFNEVDNLIFSELAYLEMGGLVPEDDAETLTIAELHRLYTEAGRDRVPILLNDPNPTLKKAVTSERFANVGVKWYTQKIDTEKQVQFAAVTFIISDELAYIAFGGTDHSLVGWREDCNLSFMNETPGQREAVRYINEIAAKTHGSLIVGGHSKGGNFAIYGAAFCDENVSKDRIIQVYSNDGPGFNDRIVNDERYLAVLDKTLKIVPHASLVGILLSSRAKRKIIKSDAKGLSQHDPSSWRVWVTQFEEADERTKAGALLDNAMDRWISSLSDENKKTLVDNFFDALEASGVETLYDINENKLPTYNAILKALSKIDPDSRSDMFDSVKKLLISGRDALKEDVMKELLSKGQK